MIEETEPLSKIDPAYVHVNRIAHALIALVPLIGAAAAEFAQILPLGLIIIPVIMLLGWWVWFVPDRQYHRWGYDAGADRLRIESGYLFYSDTMVPYGRIQHIDVDQGPIERRYGLSTLSAHTAGTHGSTITLPGLRHEEAIALRERIRVHIAAAQR
jgi:uncharacterized protein